ncbi:MAG: endonuclease/exonuclease/phosphatase family protein [Chitinophagales bacterium]
MKSKLFFWCCLLSIYVLFLGRNNVYLGSALYFLEYPLILFGGWMLWQQRKGKSKVQKKGLQIALLLGVLLLVVDAAYLYFNKESPVTSKTTPTEQIEVLTYNLLFTNGTPQSSLQSLQKHPVEILALQEITPKWEALLKSDSFLQKNYPYQKMYADKRTHGYGILSKYPIKNVEYLNNDVNRPIAQCFEIVHPTKGSLYTCNAHTASPAIAFHSPESFPIAYYKVERMRAKQWKQITEHINQKAANIPNRMILGDLNTPDFEPLCYRQMQQEYVDVFAEVGSGFGFTFPRGRLPYPVFRLDYILTQGSFDSIEAEVLEKTGSDHFGVKAVLRF